MNYLTSNRTAHAARVILVVMLLSMVLTAMPRSGQRVVAQNPPRVNTMPSYTQSITYANAAINQPIAIWGNVHDGTAPYTYRMDAGDGTTYIGSVANTKYIGHDHTYTTLGVKNMSLIVTDSLGITGTSQSAIRVFPTPLNRETEINIAIEKGLLYLYLQQNASGFWDAGNSYYNVGATGFALLAFEENGHLPTNDYDEDIYAEYVRLGLDWMWDAYEATAAVTPHNDGIQVQTEYIQGTIPVTTTGNGGYLVSGHYGYATPVGMLPIVGAHRDAASAQADIIPSGAFAGLSYYTATMYLADSLIWNQGDGTSRGGWWYYWGQNAGGYDGSTMQWPVLAMSLAEQAWGLTAPQWVRDNLWFGFTYLQGADGGIGYNGPGQAPNSAKTGGFVGASSWAGKTITNSTEVSIAVDYLGDHYLENGVSWSSQQGWAGHLYGMYGMKKGMQLINLGAGLDELWVPGIPGYRNWYDDFASYLLGDAAGLPPGLTYNASSTYGFGPVNPTSTNWYWRDSTFASNTLLGTGFAVLILTQGVLIPPPVAVIAPIASQPPNTPFPVDGSGSYHADPGKTIVEWLWDWDASDGVDWNNPDASGQMPTNPGYSTLGNRTITLRVKDDSDPPMYDTDTAVVDINQDNHAPVAVPIPAARLPSYAGRVGEDILIDGTESYDPDTGVPGGTTIISYTWDLDGDLVFDDALTSTTLFSRTTEYQGQIGLIVVDDLYSYSLPVYVDVAVSAKDIFVQSLSAFSTDGMNVDLEAVFANDATSNQDVSNVMVRFYDDHPFTVGSLIGSSYYVDLPIGATASVTANVTSTVPITQVYVWLDANENVAEWDEINNLMNSDLQDSMSITKTAEDLNGPPLYVGDEIRYTITITNDNPAQAMTNVVVTDTLPAGVTFVSATPGGYSGPNPLVWSGATLDPLATWTAVITVAVDGTADPIGGNYAEVSSDQQPRKEVGPILPPGGGNVDPNPNALEMSKTAEDLNGAPLYPGDEILYTVVVTNPLSIDQTNVVVTDAIPAGTMYVPGSAQVSQGSVSGPDPLVADFGTLAAGASANLTFRVWANGSPGQDVENYAYGDSDQQGPPPIQVGPITPPGGGTIVPNPNALDMSKTAEDLNGAPLYPGDEIAYTVVVTNLLGIDQTNVVVTDAIPMGAMYVPGSAQVSQGAVSGPDPLVADFGTLSANGVATLTFNVWANGSPGQDVENYAYGGSDQQGPPIQVGPITPPSGGTIVPNPNALTMNKTAEDLNGAPLYPGDTILYTIMVTNPLPIGQTNVVVTDAIPAFTTYVPGSAAVSQGSVSGPDPLLAEFGTLVGGTMATMTFRVTVDTDAVSQTIENYAQAGSDQLGPPIQVGPITPPGGGVVQPIPQALALSKTAQDLNGEPLYPGDEIRYSLVVTNLLGSPQNNVVITDAIPSGTMYVPGSAQVSQGSVSGPDPLVADIGTLAAGQVATFTFNVWVIGSAGDTVANYAYAGSEYQVPPMPVGPITPPGGGVIVPDPNALALSKTAQDLNGEPLYPGDTILYTVSVENLLAIDQTGVIITDAIPAGTTYVTGTAEVSQGSVSGPDPLLAELGTLGAGQSATLTFQVMVDLSAEGMTIENYAYADSGQQGPPVEVGPITPPGGGLVLPIPDALALAKTAEDLNGAPLYPGDEILYTITVQNMLDTDHTGVVITDAIPSGTTYVADSAAVSQGTISGPDPLVADVGTLAAGQIATFTFRVTVNQDAEGMVIENYAQAKGDEQEPIEVGPITPDPGGTVVLPGLALAKTAEDLSGTPLYPGDEILYTIVVTNLMGYDHPNVVITDAIPDFTTYVAGSAQVSQGSVSGPDPLVADIGTLSAYQVATFTFRVAVVSGATGQTIENYAQAGGEHQTPPIEVGPITPPDGGGVVQPPPGTVLLLSKTAQDLDGAPLYPGDTILYTISVENLLDTDQTGVVITDAVPNYTTYVAGSATVSQGSVSGPDPLVADIGTLAGNGVATFTFQVTVDQGSEGQEVENYAFADSNEQDPPVEVGPITPPGGGTVEPLPTADLAVDKAYVRGITTITYTITATNLGPDSADGAIVYDEISDFITNVTWTCQASGGAVCTPSGSGNLIEETITTFPSGGMLVFIVTGDIPLFGGEDNAVTISVPEGVIDPDLSNNTATIGKPFKILLPVIGKNPEGF